MATNCLDVYVKLPSGRNAQYDMLPTNSVKHLCEEIGKKEEIEPNRIRLKYQGKTLDKAATLGYLGVQAETILKVEIMENKLINLKIKHGCEIKQMQIGTLTTITDLITEIREEIDLNNDTLVTKTGSQLKRSANSVEESGLSDGDILTVTAKSTETTDSSSNPILDDTILDDIKSSFASNGRNVEVAFSFDTTGSMYSYLATVRQKLKSTCERLISDIPNIRISLIAHGDYCDQDKYVIRMVDLTSNAQELVTFAESVPSTGGGDLPECYEWVLKKAQSLDWAEDSAKALVVIGDSPPHDINYTDQKIDWHQELDVLIGMGVKVYGVHAGGSTESRVFYEELADRSQGCYLPLQHFDVITDMFLAVCYHEADGNQLDDFVQEIEDAGEMTSAKQEIFNQLKSAANETPETSEPKRQNSRYSYQWWVNNSDEGSIPSYCYNQQTDMWTDKAKSRSIISRPFRSVSSSPRGTVTNPPPSPNSTSKRFSKLRSSFKHRDCKKSCNIM